MIFRFFLLCFIFSILSPNFVWAQVDFDDPDIIKVNSTPKNYVEVLDEKDHKENEDLNWIEHTHKFFSKQVLNLADGVDGLFGDKQFEDIKGSTITAEQYYTSIEQRSLVKQTRFRAKWVLPNMKRKLRFVIRQTPRVNQAGQINQEAELRTKADKNADSIAAGLDYDLIQQDRFKASLGSGLLIRSTLDPYIQSRLSYAKYLGWTNFFFDQRFFVYKVDGFGGNLKADFTNPINEDFTHNYGNFFYYADETDLIEFITGPSLSQRLSEKRTISYNFKLLYENRPHERLVNHQLFVNYRQNLHKGWFWAEIIPALEFPRENNWRRVASITLKLQVIFGDY